jgi:hypothetical protein
MNCPYDGKKCDRRDICEIYPSECERYEKNPVMDTIPPDALIDRFEDDNRDC